MLRSASVKSVIQSKQNDALRDPERVERVWDEAVDGAWAPGKASLTLLSKLLQHVQDEDLGQAELTARDSERSSVCRVGVALLETNRESLVSTVVLAVEPHNKLVVDLIAAMKQQQALDDQLESEEESDEEDDEKEDEEEEEDDDDEESSPENEREEK